MHGCLGLLEGLLARIDEDDAQRGGPRGQMIFLGDVIDRGPESAQVIDRLIALREERPDTRFLLGNHEETFLMALEAGDRDVLRFFKRTGGIETMMSYGISARDADAVDLGQLAAMLWVSVPEAHQAFLKGFEHMIVEGDYVFVHAGVRPGVPLDAQRQSDLRWIREEFLRNRRRAPIPGKVIVHGHTIFEQVEERAGGIGIDTGAYHFGTLTAMGFEGDARWVLQQHRPR
ncbi:metallophosphoesterase [Sphingomonas sp. 37zxx]|uniref:metallophosphoesterase n=1 Tax=Sphingomonas sp. 37zxx TaxID=1550073 RepID=UPI000A4B7768|nr:metallophosphoesterase [Sphingomonas sp. 37zxx]